MIHIITRVLLVMLFCLFGMSAQAETYNPEPYTVKVGDKLEKLAHARSTTVKFVMEMNKGKIKNENIIRIGQVIELPKLLSGTPAVAVVKSAKAVPSIVTHSTHVTQSVAEETIALARASIAQETIVSHWNPNDIDECIDCPFNDFVVGNYPMEVVSLLKQNVVAGEYQNVLIASGDRFEAMLFQKNDQRQNVVAVWSDDRKEPARLYTAIYDGMEYALIYPEHGGNWSKMTTAPDVGELLAIKNGIEEIIGANKDAMPLAILIWKRRHPSAAPPVSQIVGVAQYAASLIPADSANNVRMASK